MEPVRPAPPFPFSRESSIRIDREGGFWHDGRRIEHAGLARAFATWIDIDAETGRYILKNAINWCFIAVEDAPLLVRGLDPAGMLALSDGSREPLLPGTLRIDEDDVPYCDVKGGKLPARFGRDAAFALLEQLQTDAAGGLSFRGRPVRRVARGAGAQRPGMGSSTTS
jgi:hypothetical protein